MSLVNIKQLILPIGILILFFFLQRELGDYLTAFIWVITDNYLNAMGDDAFWEIKGLLLFFIPTAIVLFFYGNLIKSDFRISKSFQYETLVGALVLIWLFISGIEIINGTHKWGINHYYGWSKINPIKYFIIVLLGPICEEIILRGVLLKSCLNVFGKVFSLFIVMIASMLLHIDYFSVGSLDLIMQIFVIQLIFSIVYIRAGLGISIVLHVIVNAFIASSSFQ